ncbi:MAG: VCBS repeat-containing protein [Chloroflexi bacterium]|nr:VCBS repeat-containing protein [Chloroflexota bacterium]
MNNNPKPVDANAPLSPRRRRLRWTVAILSAAVAVGLAAGGIFYLQTRPTQYRPDEMLADVTSELARHLPPDAPQPRLTDVTREAGLGSFRTFAGERTSQMPEDMGPGAAWGDYDNDGDDDLFLVSAGGAMNLPADQLLPCELYENLGDGAFRKVDGFPETRLHGMAAAWGDYDSDGHLDLVVTGYNALLLFHNEGGSGQFVRDTRLPNLKGFWSGAAWGDYDNDRRLDLYVCHYLQYVENEADVARGSVQLGLFVPFTLNPASYPGGTNALFHNNGDGTFTDVAPSLKVTNPEGRSLGGLWHDFDDDGWLDLYVANDVSDNVFYRNLGGTFEDISHPAYVADYRSAMGLAAGDYNRDGDDDLFITHWVAQENALYDNLWADFNAKSAAKKAPAGKGPSPTQPSQRGRAATESSSSSFSSSSSNSPFEDDDEDEKFRRSLRTISTIAVQRPPLDSGRPLPITNAADSPSSPPIQQSSPPKYPLRFMDIADMKGLGQVALPYVGWGAEFVDLDGDGWLDLVAANGNTLELDGPLPRKLKPQEPFLFWNRCGEHFYNLAPLHKSFAEPHVSRGLAVSDYVNDGDMDLLVVHLGEGVQLWRNDMQTGNWLKVRLRSRLKNGAPLGFGDGSKVIAHIGGVALRRSVTGVSYLSQHTRVLHFGLGAANQVQQLEVRWHAGPANSYFNLDANVTWEIIEGDPTPKRVATKPSGASRSSQTEPLPSAAREGRQSRESSSAAPLTRSSGRESALNSSGKIMSGRPSPAASFLGREAAVSQERAGTSPAAKPPDDKVRLLAFWNKQRGAMNALKVEKDIPKAIQLFREALELDPRHEDSRYYLGQCLAAQGDAAGALAQLEELTRINPQSHRGFQQWGTLRAVFAETEADLAAAEKSLEQAHSLNPEETGALLVLGEVALLRHDLAKAEQRLADACATNPKAVAGFFLRGYLAWKRGDQAGAEEWLRKTREALGQDWKPQGSTSEGDVQQKQHAEKTPLTRFWERWDGVADPAKSFAALDAFLKGQRGLPAAKTPPK